MDAALVCEDRIRVTVDRRIPFRVDSPPACAIEAISNSSNRISNGCPVRPVHSDSHGARRGRMRPFGSTNARRNAVVIRAVMTVVAVAKRARWGLLGCSLDWSRLERVVMKARGGGCGALSLSLEEDKHAVRIYERVGVGRVENAWRMRLGNQLP